jgi:chromosome segregation ATPase
LRAKPRRRPWLTPQVRFCKIKFNWAHYTRRKAISQAKSEEFKQEHTRLARLKEKHKPLSQLSEVLKAHREELGEKLDDEDRQGRNIQEKMRVCRRVLDDQVRELPSGFGRADITQDKQDDNTQNSLDSLKRSAKDFRGKLRQEESRLEALKAIPQPAPRNETLEAAEKVRPVLFLYSHFRPSRKISGTNSVTPRTRLSPSNGHSMS